MRAPFTLTIPAAVFGVVMSVVCSALAAQVNRPTGVLVVIAIWAGIPVVATVIAYRQGFDRGFSAGRKAELPKDGQEVGLGYVERRRENFPVQRVC